MALSGHFLGIFWVFCEVLYDMMGTYAVLEDGVEEPQGVAAPGWPGV